MFRIKQPTESLRGYVEVKDDFSNTLLKTIHDEAAEESSSFDPGVYVAILTLPAGFIAPRAYRLELNATIYNVRHCIPPTELPASFMHTMPTYRAYVAHVADVKLMPLFAWHTRPA